MTHRELADVMQAIAEHGPAGFYRGRIAQGRWRTAGLAAEADGQKSLIWSKVGEVSWSLKTSQTVKQR